MTRPSPYTGLAYCTHCMKWYPRETVEWERHKPLCPVCGMKVRVRPKRKA
ncbi:MAG: hypothetical protein JRM97_08960 [Nitrososphaerota archaeon]|nr:hypothetical protein [Nitrososphaerota archaeon]